MALPSPKQLPITQLFIIGICRFSQPFSLASIFPYLPDYLENLGIAQSSVAIWLGLFAVTFAFCEALFALPWTKLSEQVGRKPAILLALSLQMIGNVGLGFCKTRGPAFLCIAMVGSSNGMVAVLRTMVAELVPAESQLQAKAFSFLPTAASIGSILGPVVGGSLAMPVVRYPRVFGSITIFKEYPFALPNLISGCLFVPGLVATTLLLQETLKAKCKHEKMEMTLNEAEEAVGLLKTFPTSTVEEISPRSSVESQGTIGVEKVEENADKEKRSVFHLLSNPYIWINSISGLHSIGFDHLLPVFLHFPAEQSSSGSILHFAQGFGKGSRFIGVLLTSAGICGILTAVVAYPRLVKRYGELTSLRVATLMFPLIYFVFPFSVRPSSAIVRVAVLVVLLLLKVFLSVSALQSCMILLTNSAEKSDLSGAHGVNFAIASVSRGIGSLSSGLVFSMAVRWGYVVLPFWMLAGWGVLSAFLVLRGMPRR